jgi:hypothetical protein
VSNVCIGHLTDVKIARMPDVSTWLLQYYGEGLG